MWIKLFVYSLHYAPFVIAVLMLDKLLSIVSYKIIISHCHSSISVINELIQSRVIPITWHVQNVSISSLSSLRLPATGNWLCQNIVKTAACNHRSTNDGDKGWRIFTSINPCRKSSIRHQLGNGSKMAQHRSEQSHQTHHSTRPQTPRAYYLSSPHLLPMENSMKNEAEMGMNIWFVDSWCSGA